MYDAVDIANYFISQYADQPGSELTPMKLVKLVYVSHGWHLALAENPLLDENAEAWMYGPVVPSVYHTFKHYRSAAVQAPIDRGYRVLIGESITKELDDSVKSFLDKIWDVYGQFTGYDLSAMTHEEGTPWYQTWHHLGGKEQKGIQIPDNLIKKYYQDRKKVSQS